MFCSNCGNEFEGKFCSECGTAATQGNVPTTINSGAPSTMVRFDPTAKVGILEVDSKNRLFKINNKFSPNTKMGLGRKALAISTFGASVVAEKTIKAVANVVSDAPTKNIYSFSDIIEFELMEDDAQVTKGGTGKAFGVGIATGVLINPVVGGLGAIAGGVTGKRTTKKVVDSLVFRITVNDLDNPCLLIPIITEPTKTKSKEYQQAFEVAQKTLSILNVMVSK